MDKKIDQKIIKIDQKIIEQEIANNLNLAEKIHKKLNLGSSKEAYSFIITNLNLIYKNKKNFTEKELENIITDGGNDVKIDAIYIHNKFIDIFDFKNKIKEKKSDLVEFKDNILKYIINGMKKEEYESKLFNNCIKEKLIECYSEKNRYKKKRVYIIRGNFKNEHEYIKEIREEFNDHNVDVKFLNRQNIINSILKTENYLPEWQSEIEKNDILFNGPKIKKEVLLRVPIYKLIQLYNLCLEGDYDLFNKNVRGFLRKKTLLKEIFFTIENDPDNFHIYHNGITIITSDKIKQSGKYFLIKKPQVINGLQTIESIYKKYKEKISDEKLKKAKIICKIIEANDDFADKICQTSNTQIPVKLWDLRSNDNIQLKLERYINNIDGNRYQYIRKSGNKVKKDKIGIFLHEFIQWVYSAIFEKPADAKDDKKLLFDCVSDKGKYKEIEAYLNSCKIEEIDDICKIGLFVKNKILKGKKEIKGIIKDMGFHIMAGMYLLRDKDSLEKNFSNFFIILEEHINNRKGEEVGITNNKIFTKSNEAWEFLKSKIN